MNIDISRFKVMHNDKVLRGICIKNIQMPKREAESERKIYEPPTFIDVFVINEDGNIILIHDEAWTFQFIPVVTKPE